MNRPDFHPNQPVTVHADPAVLDEVTITTAEWCPVCDGEKVAMHDVPGGRWNSYIGTWEPDEVEERCERCEATGMVTRTRCARCGELHDTDEWGVMVTDAACECDGGELLRFHYLALEAERIARSNLPATYRPEVDWNTVHYIAARNEVPVTYDRAGKLTWAVAKIGAGTVRSPSTIEEAHRGAVTQAA